jgi:hypothetical protein
MRGHAPAPVIQGDGGATGLPEVRRIAEAGVRSARSPLPHAGRIARAFGANHNIGGIRAAVGGTAAAASAAMGTKGGYATGERIAFARPPSLRVAAHEAAHIIQQRGGLNLPGGVGRAGDRHERHADAVADRVVRGQSAADLLARYAGPMPKAAEGVMPTGPAHGAGPPAVQMWEALENAPWMATGRWKSVMKDGVVRHMTAENLTLEAGEDVGGENANPAVAAPQSWGRLRQWKMIHPGRTPGYVRMHMLSGRLGGPGDQKDNLAPGTNAMNQLHARRAENKLIKCLDAGGTVFKYTVQADYQDYSGNLRTNQAETAWQDTLRRLYWRASYQAPGAKKVNTFGVIREEDDLDTQANWNKH